jgi:hypothetical protein
MASLIILIGLVYAFFNYATGCYYRVYSPDEQYSVYASKYIYENFLPAMPGQSGDASGKVFLYDEIEKKVINSGDIPMVSMTSEIEWAETEAYFKSDFYPNADNTWKLPRPLKPPPPKALADGTVITFSSLGNKLDQSKFEMVSGCKKLTSYTSYNGLGEPILEWNKTYSKAKTESCDFTSYIIHEKRYRQNILIAETFKHSGCDDCETYPCGTWQNFDASGKLLDSMVYEPCNLNFRPFQKE